MQQGRWMSLSMKLGIESMDRIINQFRRIYTDDGSGDKDFTIQEERLKQAEARLARGTQELAKAAENLNRAALSVMPPPDLKH